MGPYAFHADLQKYASTRLPIRPWLLPLLNAAQGLGLASKRLAPGLKSCHHRIAGYQGGRISLMLMGAELALSPAPCLVYLHGGGFMLKAAPFHLDLLGDVALKTPCTVVFVDYRLAPKYPFPAGVEDSYAAFDWVCRHAAQLGIDPRRIAIGGDSAGGALAAAVAQMARDRNASRPCFQLLIYPVTDARQQTASMREYTDTPFWDATLNALMWRLYLRNGDQGKRAYASPLEAASLVELPDAYVEVAEFDCLRDEGIAYAEALEKAGSRVELFRTSGTMHGFELAYDSEPVRLSVGRRVAALKRAFGA